MICFSNHLNECLKNYYILLFIFFSQCFGQPATRHNNLWIHSVERVNIKKKSTVVIEGVFRFANGFAQPQQLFIRPSYEYKFSNKFVGSIGYTYYNTYSYGDLPMNKTSIPEHHIWVQGLYSHKWHSLFISHRLRDEHRMVGMSILDSNKNYIIDHFEYRNRVRYMLTLTYPLLKRGDKAFLNGILADEAFFNIGSFSGASLMNQNRIIAGFGFIFSPFAQMQVCYIHQNIWNKTNTLEEVNPTLRLTFIHNLNF
jgi:hypothetical protein